MSNARAELDAFTQFADRKLADGSDYDLVDLFELWQQEQGGTATSTEDTEAVQAAIDDFDSGDRGRPGGELTKELRRSLESQ